MAVSVVADPVNQGAAPFLFQAPASSNILTRLRVETRGEHDAVERVLDLMSAALTVGAYRNKLVQFYGFYAPLEAALQSRDAYSGGTGAGLTIARKLVERHRRQVWPASVAGEERTFFFTLSAADQQHD